MHVRTYNLSIGYLDTLSSPLTLCICWRELVSIYSDSESAGNGSVSYDAGSDRSLILSSGIVVFSKPNSDNCKT